MAKQAKKPRADLETVQKSEAKHYRILHTQVGPWPKDRVVSFDEFKEHSEHVDVGRLLRIGAIERTTSPVTTDPLPPSPETPGNLPAPVDTESLPAPETSGKEDTELEEEPSIPGSDADDELGEG